MIENKKVMNIKKENTEFGVTSRLMILIVIISFLICAFVIFLNGRRNLNQINSQFKEIERVLNTRLKVSFAQPIWNYDFSTIERLVKSELSDPRLRGMRILDTNGNMIISLERKADGSIGKSKDANTGAEFRGVLVTYARHDGVDEYIAEIQFELDKEAYYRAMWKDLAVQTVEILMIVAILVWTLSYVTLKRVVRPLDTLRKRLQVVWLSLREGTAFSPRQDVIDPTAFPELKHMAHELESMFSELDLASQNLRQSQQRLSLVLDGASLGSWDWNLQNKTVNIDDRFAEMIGLKTSDFQNDDSLWERLIHPDDYPKFQFALKQHFEQRSLDCQVEYRMRHKKGYWVWMLSRGKVNQKDDLGKPIRISGTHLDITERKASEEELITLNILQTAILESAGYAIIATSSDGTVATFNKAAVKMFGYSQEEIIGKSTFAVFHEPYELSQRQKDFSSDLGKTLEPGFPVLVAKSLAGMPNEYEWTYVRKDGSQFPVLLSITALKDPDNKLMGFLGVAVDMTEQKRNLETLRQTNMQLEALTTHARVMAEKALAANKTQSQFIANMSHEIRTPMNAIIGYADLMLETPMSDEQKNYISAIQKSGSLLLDLVNNILEISKIETGVLQLKNRDFNFKSCVSEIVEILSPKANQKSIRLILELGSDSPEKVNGDQLRLRQVLVNLLENAIKFTEEGTVTLRVGPFENLESNWIKAQFEVHDTGIGISRDKVANLFERFNQLDDSITKKYGGTGLGLAISREIIRLMRGDIQVKSELGKGTVFTFFVLLQTIQEEKQVEEKKIENMPQELRSLNILLAEDTEENQILIQHYMKKLPYKIDVAVNGLEAVEKFQKEKYDLVLMDMQMPVMDGLTATKRIREIEDVRGQGNIPIIALTAYALDEQKKLCLDSGCTLHLPKPVKKDELLRAILSQTQYFKVT